MQEDKLDGIANTEARGEKQGEDASRLQQGASDTTDARVLPENDEQPGGFSDQASSLLSKTCMLIWVLGNIMAESSHCFQNWSENFKMQIL